MAQICGILCCLPDISNCTRSIAEHLLASHRKTFNPTPHVSVSFDLFIDQAASFNFNCFKMSFSSPQELSQRLDIYICVFFCNCVFLFFYLLVYLCRSCTWPSLLPYRQHRQRHEQDQNGPRSHCARLCQVIPQSQNWPQKWNVQISIWLRSYEIPPHNGLYSVHSAFFVSFLNYCISRRCKGWANMLGVNYGTAHCCSDWFFSVV